MVFIEIVAETFKLRRGRRPLLFSQYALRPIKKRNAIHTKYMNEYSEKEAIAKITVIDAITQYSVNW